MRQELTLSNAKTIGNQLPEFAIILRHDSHFDFCRFKIYG